MTPEEALDALDARFAPASERDEAADVLRAFVEGAHEIQCPACSATIRARMADAVDGRLARAPAELRAVAVDIRRRHAMSASNLDLIAADLEAWTRPAGRRS